MPGTITVTNGNLFSIAAAILGDATQWINIAQANGLKDPVINQACQLIIPSASTAFDNGISPQ